MSRFDETTESYILKVEYFNEISLKTFCIILVLGNIGF